MRLKIDETWQVVGFPFEQNFLFQSPECFKKSGQLVLGNLPIRIVFIDERKNQPCKMKLLKGPKYSTKQWQKNICLRESKKQHTCEPWRTDPKETRRTPSLAESMNCKQSKFWSWASALSSVQESMITIQYSSWPFAKEAKREPVADQLGALCLVCTASSRSRPGSVAPALRVESLLLLSLLSLLSNIIVIKVKRGEWGW